MSNIKCDTCDKLTKHNIGQEQKKKLGLTLLCDECEKQQPDYGQTKKSNSKFFWITFVIIFILIFIFGSNEVRSNAMTYFIIGSVFGGIAELLRKGKSHYDKKPLKRKK